MLHLFKSSEDQVMRSFLGRFQIQGVDALKPMRYLSGGKDRKTRGTYHLIQSVCHSYLTFTFSTRKKQIRRFPLIAKN